MWQLFDSLQNFTFTTRFRDRSLLTAKSYDFSSLICLTPSHRLTWNRYTLLWAISIWNFFFRRNHSIWWSHGQPLVCLADVPYQMVNVLTTTHPLIDEHTYGETKQICNRNVLCLSLASNLQHQHKYDGLCGGGEKENAGKYADGIVVDLRIQYATD